MSGRNSETIDQAEVRRAVQTILEELDSWRSIRRAGRVGRLVKGFAEYLAVVLFVLSIALLLIGWIGYHISPLHSLRELAFTQQQQTAKQTSDSLKRLIVRQDTKLGTDFLDVGQNGEAVHAFSKALALDPYDAEAQIGMAKAELFQQAAKTYDPEVINKVLTHLKSLSTEGDPHVLLFLGILYQGVNSDSAWKYYDQAIAADLKMHTSPRLAEAYYRRGVLYETGRNQADSASQDYSRACDLSPWNPSYCLNLADQYYKRAAYDAALTKYDLIGRVNGPAALIAYYYLANIWRLKGNLDSASTFEKKSLRFWQMQGVDTLPYNERRWFFNLGWGGFVTLKTKEDKMCYAYHTAALTSFLRDEQESTTQLLREARKLRPCGRWLEKLMRYDTARLMEQRQMVQDTVGFARVKAFAAAFSREWK